MVTIDVICNTNAVADCFYYDGSLKERWSREALKWACCAASRHAASRSHQVYCALSPSLNSAACTALLAALQKCLENATMEGLDTAIELLCTLRVLLDNTPAQKLVMYPHVFAACIALLNSSVVRVGELATALLVQLLRAVDLSSPAVQQTILSVLPIDENKESKGKKGSGRFAHGGSFTMSYSSNQHSLTNVDGSPSSPLWLLGEGLLGNILCGDGSDSSYSQSAVSNESPTGPWYSMHQLLIKCLFQQESEALALQGMGSIFNQLSVAGSKGCIRPRINQQENNCNIVTINSMAMVHSSTTVNAGIEAIIGHAESGIALSLAASLPWLCVHVGAGELADSAAVYLQEIAGACSAVGWHRLSAVLGVLAMGPPASAPGSGYTAWLPDVVGAMCEPIFPVYSRLVIQRLMEVVQRAPERYQSAALSVLKNVFEVPDLDLGSGSWFVNDSRLVDLLSNEVGGVLGAKVLDLLQALSAYNTLGSDGNALMQLEWLQCMDENGQGNRVCSEALRRVVDACPGVEELIKAGSADDGAQSAGPGEQLLPFLTSSIKLK